MTGSGTGAGGRPERDAARRRPCVCSFVPLWILLALLLSAWLAAAAGSAFSAGASAKSGVGPGGGGDVVLGLTARLADALGAPLGEVRLSGGCRLATLADPAGPVWSLRLDGTRLSRPGLSGRLAGGAEVRFVAGGLRILGLDLAYIPDPGPASGDAMAEEPMLPALRLRGTGRWDAAASRLDLTDARLDVGAGATRLGSARGRLGLGPGGADLDLTLSPGPGLGGGAGVLDGARLALALDWTAQASGLDLRVRRARLTARNAPADAALELAGILHFPTGGTPGDTTGDTGDAPADDALAADNATLTLGGQGLALRLRRTPGPDGASLHVDLDGRGLDLAQLAPVLDAWLGARLAASLGGPLAGCRPAGRADLTAACDLGPAEERADLRLGLRGAGFLEPMGRAGGQDLEAVLRLGLTRPAAAPGQASAARTRPPAVCTARLDLTRGALLAGRYYFDFAGERRVRLTASVRARDPAARNLATWDRAALNLEAGLDWGGHGRFAATGHLAAPGPGGPGDRDFAAQVRLTDLRLGPLFEDLAVAPYGLSDFQGEAADEGQVSDQTSNQTLNQAPAQHYGMSGTAELAADFERAGGVTECDGRLTVRDLGLAGAGGLRWTGAALDLPLHYRFGVDEEHVGSRGVPAERWGELRPGRIVTRRLDLRPAPLPVALWANRLFVRGRVELPLWGGSAGLAEVRCERPLGPDWDLSLRARLDGLDLSEVPGLGAWLPRGAVTLGGDLGRVRLSAARLEAPGEVNGTLFGGALTVNHVFALRPFSDSREAGCRVAARGVDLEPLSRAADFGRVTGRVDVTLDDLVVAYGQPASLDLTVQTSEPDDFDKEVSLKAVDNLSVLGTGSGIGDLGVGIFSSFFKEFSYDRIGFRCTLNNDSFQLRGLIHRGGLEYLIKKPLFTGINVINRSPESGVSFSDMLDRVKRVTDQGAAGPQISM